MEEPVLNAHNKQEYPPMHTAEHILNAPMRKRILTITSAAIALLLVGCNNRPHYWKGADIG